MNFGQQLNAYMELLDCTAKRLSQESGVSAATLSRYRSGERVPERDSDTFSQLCRNFNTLVGVLNINLTRMSQQTNYDPSTIFRIRNGSRQISEPVGTGHRRRQGGAGRAAGLPRRPAGG